MFEPVTEEDFGVKIALCAPEQTEVLQHADFVAFGELSAELIAQQQFDLLLVVGASPLQTALVKYWCEESGCIAACVETLDKDQCDAENVIVNLKDKFEGREFPNNVDVADVRHLAYDDNQLLAFSTKAQLLNFLSDEECQM
ncbi:hypothetical protein JCM19238_1708 [Vibrio ponticus]|nr:hypothetical protein JCM19238_1708 [Vibrio ponticus]